MLNNNEISKKYIEYLREAGVNTQVLNYIEKNIYIVSAKLREIIGNELIPIYKDRDIDKLKNGSDTFKITEEGAIWWVDERAKNSSTSNENKIKVNGANYTFYHGGMSSIDENILSSSNYNYITSTNNQISHKNLRLEHGNKDGEEFYNGSITEKVLNDRSELEEQHDASWQHEREGQIPKRELLASKKIYAQGYYNNGVKEYQTYYKNFREDLDWQFVISGKTQGEKLQEQIEETTRSSNIVIDGVKNFFYNLLNKTRGIEK